jgi:hypothetical protein
LLPLLWAAVLVAATAAPMAAQSLTAGSLSGTVLDSTGTALNQASVTVTDRATGLSRAAQTERDGRFTFTLLAPSQYDVLVEQLGYRPRLVQGILVFAGSNVDITVNVVAVPPPVTTVDTVLYGAGAQPAGFVLGGSPAPVDFADLLDDRRLLTSVAGLSSASSSSLEMEGLPGRLAGLVIDAVPRTAAQHPQIAAAGLDGLAFPLAAFGQSELPAAAADVQWSGFTSGFVSGQSLRGARSLQPKLYADWSSEGPRGGVVLSGPVVRDTASFVVGVEAAQLDRTLPAPWPRDSLTSSLVTRARDSAGTDLSAYLQSYKARTKLLSGFARFDWQIAQAYALAVRASVSSATVTNADLGTGLAPSLGSTVQANDASAEAWLTSRLSDNAGLELRFSVDGSTRDYRAPPLAGTVFVDDGLSAGSDGALPGRFQRTDVRLSVTGHLATGLHQLKAGVALGFTSHDMTYAAGTSGQFLFAGASEFAQQRGVFTQTVGPLPVATFQMPQTALYLQDLWTPAAGLELLLGIRYDVEQWPKSDVILNQAWKTATGLSNGDVPKSKGQPSPRLSFRWSAGAARQWAVRGSAGLFFGGADPAVMGELLSHTGAAETRRGIGSLGSWPAVPDSTIAAVTGPTLTLLSPSFTPPRTGRVTLGLDRALGAGMSLDVAGTYRHTDFLPRRLDLNLVTAASAKDQYDRPIYGTLVQQGSLLAASPGSNRRFSGFDMVSALNPDGFSDYWGVTVSLERTVMRGFDFLASYTFSRTTDNWLGARSGVPDAQLPPGLSGSDWTSGRSDFDVPHRVELGAEVSFPGRMGVRIGVLYQYRSGYPFTPGFRTGVDANGDGSASNDPAFVDNQVTGMDAVVARWDCLRTQIGRFAARNSCRTAAVQNLNARLVVGIARIGGYPAELVVDALNLLKSDVGIVDQALYLVDRTKTLVTSPLTGVVTVPLVANPNFGKLLVRQTGAQVLRAGIRVSY